MKRAVRSQGIEVPGPAGLLEGLLEQPENPARVVAVVCHPHPLHQGTMQNKVVHTLARRFQRLGAPAVRFNFRGVGASAGDHADGVGEVDDALAVVAWAVDRYPGARVVLAGFSFGAGVALSAARKSAAVALITVAPPIARIGTAFEQPRCPWLIVHGERDDLVPIEDLRAWHEGLDPRPKLVVIDGATHFFHGKLNVLGQHVTEFARQHVAGLHTDPQASPQSSPVGERSGKGGL